MGNGKDEEAVAAVGNTGQSVIPGSEGCHKTKETTGLDDGRVGLAMAVPLDVADTEQEEGEIEEEEQQEESHSGSQGAEQQDGGEDEPAHQEQTEGIVKHGGATLVGSDKSRLDVEATGGQDNSEGDPETTIRGQSSGTKSVTDSHFPHAGKQLNETTITESQSDDNVGSGDVASTHVDTAQHERGEGESTQTQRSRVGKLALLNRLVQTGLELSSEGREVVLGRIDLGQRTIAKASGGLGHFVFLVGHLRGELRSIGILRSAIDGVIRTDVLLKSCVVLDGHGALQKTVRRSQLIEIKVESKLAGRMEDYKKVGGRGERPHSTAGWEFEKAK